MGIPYYLTQQFLIVNEMLLLIFGVEENYLVRSSSMQIGLENHGSDQIATGWHSR